MTAVGFVRCPACHSLGLPQALKYRLGAASIVGIHWMRGGFRAFLAGGRTKHTIHPPTPSELKLKLAADLF